MMDFIIFGILNLLAGINIGVLMLIWVSNIIEKIEPKGEEA